MLRNQANIPLLLIFTVMAFGELEQAADEQLNSDADANADNDTNAILDAEAYHKVGKQWMNS